MTYLLFPGRHLLNTAFQAHYVRALLQMPLNTLDFLPDTLTPTKSLSGPPIDQIVFAITSSNQEHARYNPIPFHVRAIGVDRFARPLEMTFGIRYRIIGIPHYRPTPRFAAFVLKEIQEQTEGNLTLTPDNCVVLCSTPAVIAMYQALGFAILPAELGEVPAAATPIDLLHHMVAAGEGWFTNPGLRQKLAPATFDLWQDFPDIPRRILRLWRDPLLNEAGSLTEDRDYAAYAYGMGNNSIIQIKYDDIKTAVVPGKIVDEGCADGALLALLAKDFPDSDLIGIEITGEFLARCHERQRAGDFGGSFVHFHQRNITQPIFEPNSIDTTLCNSTVHELWSYGEQAKTVQAYLAEKYAQTRRHGRLLIRDVVGPDAGDQEVYLWLNNQDGRNDNVLTEFDDHDRLEDHLRGLSTYGRFQRFAHDFLAGIRPQEQIHYRLETIKGDPYAVLSLRAACEFLSKKDYIDNWRSEMCETFAFWGFADWQKALTQAGFQLIITPGQPEQGSRVYTNPWIVKNRWEGKVALFTMGDAGHLRPLPWPPTNVVMVAEKQ